MDKDKIVAKVKEISKNKTYVAAACGVVALIVVLIVVNVLFNSPKAVANKFMKAWEKQDPDKMMKLVWYDEDDLDEDDVEDMLESMTDDDNEIEYEFKKVSSKGKKSAKVKYKVEVDDEEYTLTLAMKKDGGKWKVNIAKMDVDYK